MYIHQNAKEYVSKIYVIKKKYEKSKKKREKNSITIRMKLADLMKP